jgi:3-oxoacyl-[acyl-carrier protein] reductase
VAIVTIAAARAAVIAGSVIAARSAHHTCAAVAAHSCHVAVLVATMVHVAAAHCRRGGCNRRGRGCCCRARRSGRCCARVTFVTCDQCTATTCCGNDEKTNVHGHTSIQHPLSNSRATLHRMNISLQGKVVLVTGGARGIGAATARAFAEAGALVAIGYERAQKQADLLVAEIGAERCAAFACDLGSPDAGKNLVAHAIAKFGRLDVLVVNHGVWPPEDVAIDRMDESQWRRTLAVNLDSVFSLTKYAVMQMKAQSPKDQSDARGHVVLVASTAAQRGEAFHADYAASKGALISMTKGLATELARDRIYVNCVAPGWVKTDMSAPALADAKTREKVLSTIPMGRVGSPEEIAAPIVFLCTSHAGFITGEVLNVNGGAVLAG